MASLRNQLRPKHQVLILKCYPKFQKNVAEVKPNSSELSYLLYYASTRRSKIQKVGAFLEKKTEADVRRGKVGNVQVTLAILAALIERTRRDLTLYAPYVLRILQTVLASKRLGLVEDSVATFQAFCEHQDVATFAADQALIRLYEDVVGVYASFASADEQSHSLAGDGSSRATPLTKSVVVKWRAAGLTALESITRTDAIGVDGGLQLSSIVPVLLRNLHAGSEDQIIALHAKLEREEGGGGGGGKSSGVGDRDPTKGRPSTATQRTDDTAQTTDGTTEEADRIAEEEVGMLALQSLKNIFSSNNRGQIRLATQSMLRFMLEVVKPASIDRPGTAKTSKTTNTTNSMLIGSWSTAMMQMVTRWTPVQDRFVIMVTAMEELVKSPIAEENLEAQLVLVILVDSLLSSSINMIGLSVMDVLLGLVQHILLLLQLGGQGSNVLPHHQQTDAIDLFGEADKRLSKELGEPVAAVVEEAKDEKRPSTTRQRLLDRLRFSIGALANHIYYSDQIADMIAAILLRLKPSPLSAVSNPVAAVENPEAAARAISDSVKMQEDPKTDAFFSFGTARVTALNAIKDILVVANSKSSVTGAGAVGRNRVQVQTWEGTQWLLRDEDRRVRRAYVDALTTWLRLEMSKNDLSVMEDRESRRTKAESTNGGQPARALSSASRRSKTAAKTSRSTFLQLLHLAIYDNAIETPEDESEILLLHLLSYRLVEKLGVNAVQHGLPMFIRLQEDINMSDAILTPKAKIVVGSLVHGYFWTLLERFDFDSTLVGHEIISEIRRRKNARLWLQAVEIPPVPLEKIMVAGHASAIKYLDSQTTQTEVLKPFDALPDLVNQIAIAYDNSIASPPNSPPASPGRNLSTPILATSTATLRARELPGPIRDAMLGSWTKGGCLAAIESSLNRTGSLHGSQRGTLRSLKNGYLHADSAAAQQRDSSPGSDGVPTSPSGRRSLRRGIAAGKAPGLRTSIPPSSDGRARSPNSSEPAAATTTSSGVIRFGELKRLVDGNTGGASSSSASGAPRDASIDGALSASAGDHRSSNKHLSRRTSVSAGSESMVDAEGVSDEENNNNNEENEEAIEQVGPIEPQQGIAARSRAASQSRGGSVPGTPRPDSGSGGGSGGGTTANSRALRTRSSSTASAEDPEANARALAGEIVPTVVRPGSGTSGGGGGGSVSGGGGGGRGSNEYDDDPDAVPPVPPLPEGIIGRVRGLSLSTNTASAKPAPLDVSLVSPLGSFGGLALKDVGSTPTTTTAAVGGGAAGGGGGGWGSGAGAGAGPSPESKRRSNAQRILSGIDAGNGSPAIGGPEGGGGTGAGQGAGEQGGAAGNAAAAAAAAGGSRWRPPY